MDIPWPAKLVLLVHDSDGTTSAYGLFDTEEELDEYVANNAEDIGGATTSAALLWAK